MGITLHTHSSKSRSQLWLLELLPQTLENRALPSAQVTHCNCQIAKTLLRTCLSLTPFGVALPKQSCWGKVLHDSENRDPSCQSTFTTCITGGEEKGLIHGSLHPQNQFTNFVQKTEYHAVPPINNLFSACILNCLNGISHHWINLLKVVITSIELW